MFGGDGSVEGELEGDEDYRGEGGRMEKEEVGIKDVHDGACHNVTL